MRWSGWAGAAFTTVAGLLVSTLGLATDRWLRQRTHMVEEQIEKRGIHNPELLRILRATPRHRFVPPQVRRFAYDDTPLPLGYGATISQPYIVALMTNLLEVRKHHRVLEVGTGSGYQAAILAQMAEQVYTVEFVPELAASAEATLQELGYRNVIVRQGDGREGWPDQAPFDRIMVTASPAELPLTLVDQLAPGGRMIIPVGPSQNQELTVIDKHANGAITRTPAGPVVFVPLRGN